MKYCSFVDQDPKHFQSTRTHTSGASISLQLWQSFKFLCEYSQIFARNDGNPIAALKELWKWAKSAEANGIIRGVEHFIKTNKQKERNRVGRLEENNNGFEDHYQPAADLGWYRDTIAQMIVMGYLLHPQLNWLWPLPQVHAGSVYESIWAPWVLLTTASAPPMLQTSCRGGALHISSRTISLVSPSPISRSQINKLSSPRSHTPFIPAVAAHF